MGYFQNMMEKGLIKSWKRSRVDEGYGSHKLMCSCPQVVSDCISVSDETYGRRSHLYFVCTNYLTLTIARTAIRRVGGKPNSDWNPSHPFSFELRVSYFKGSRWWE